MVRRYVLDLVRKWRFECFFFLKTRILTLFSTYTRINVRISVPLVHLFAVPKLWNVSHAATCIAVYIIFYTNIYILFLKKKTQRTHTCTAYIDTLTKHAHTHTHSHTRAWTGFQKQWSSARLLRSAFVGQTAGGGSACDCQTTRGARRLLPAAPARACTSQRTWDFLSVAPPSTVVCRNPFV